MERFAVALAFVLCLLPPFLGISALAEDSKTAGNDSSAVRATVETYMEDLPEAEQTDQITILDISADIASVKLVTLRSVAYMTLLKSGGEWKILSVVQRLDN
jgi:GTP:adenosylcobinamide-phosphate guanylyltransferase